MPVVDVKSAQEFCEIIKGDKVVVDFSASWCAPCRVISKTYEKFSDEFLNVVFCTVDIENIGSVAKEYLIKAIPTFVYFKEGKRIGDITGADSIALKAFVSNAAAEGRSENEVVTQ